MTDVTFEIVPWAKLKLSPLNARFDRPVETKDLETSIPAAGRLIHPLDCYRDGDDVMVWDGGRRLAACQALMAGKKSKLPPALKDGPPCLVWASADQAAVNSLATFVREAMHPADEFLACKRLVDQHLDLGAVAATLNLTTARVKQLLRLVGLAPEVFAAFQAGKFPLDAAEAFTLTMDHERQRQVLASFKGKTPNTWAIRDALNKGAVHASDRMAKFVGVEAYEAAGGTFLQDLFQRTADSWANGDLVQQLARTKLDALAATLLEAGWGWVQETNDSYEWNKGYERAIVTKTDDLPAGQMADLGVFLQLKHSGELVVLRGYRKIAKGKASTPAGKLAASDPALYGYGHGGHAKLTQVATQATKVALLDRPDAAYDALLTTLAWAAFRSNGDPLKSNASLLQVERIHGVPSMHVAGEERLDKAREDWNGRLPKARVAFCDYIADLPAKEKAKLLALVFADTLNASEAKFEGWEHKPTRWAHLGWMARHAGVEITKAWTPDAEFLKGGSRDALHSALEDMGGAYIGGAAGEGLVHASAYKGAKKGDLVSAVSSTAKKVGTWTPKLLATFTDAQDPPATPPLADDGEPGDE